MGARSYINGGMVAASENANIVIGEDCMISYGVHLRTDMHRHGLGYGGADKKLDRIGSKIGVRTPLPIFRELPGQ